MPGIVGLSTFQSIESHGPLSADYLFALQQPQLKDRKSYGKRLCDFYNEDNAPHGGQYLHKPWQQRQTDDPRLQAIVYDNTIRAWKALAAAGFVEDRPSNLFREKEDFWHEHMTACITASIELACRAQGLTFISKRDVLKGKNLSINVPITFGGEYYDGPLRPDSVFAIQYPSGGRRHFFLEADRDTEGINLKTLKAKSYRRKLLQYRKLVSDGIYKEFLGIEAGVLCLHVTTGEAHMQKMIDTLSDITEGKGNNFNLFKYDPDFGRMPVISPPKPSYGTEPWWRAIRQPFSILEA